MKNTVAVTADALVTIRTDTDPYAHLFVTEGGNRMVSMATSVDRIYIEYNTARYRYFSGFYEMAAREFSQLIIVGAGYDTRDIQMENILSGCVRVFEIDFADKLASKKDVLVSNGVNIPDNIVYCPADLEDPDLVQVLRDRGLDTSKPSLVIMEGVSYFLNPKVLIQFLDSSKFKLASGSKFIFDYWNNQRISVLNARVESKTGKKLFNEFPFPDTPSELKQELQKHGFPHVTIKPLDGIVREFYKKEPDVEFPDAWFIVEAGN